MPKPNPNPVIFCFNGLHWHATASLSTNLASGLMGSTKDRPHDMKYTCRSSFVQGTRLKPSFLSKKKYLQEDLKIFRPIPTFVNCSTYCPPLHPQPDKINKQWSYDIYKGEQRVFSQPRVSLGAPWCASWQRQLPLRSKLYLLSFSQLQTFQWRTWLITLGSIFTVTRNACFFLFNALSFYFQGLWSRIASFCQTWRSINW